MAGESPDRSKQHKSSEPTSGSAGSVPETRDPRLAVSREKDSSGAAVDTATKVLSVRDVKEAAGSAEDAKKPEAPKDEDADLREAVSAWVRSADTTKKPKAEADASAKPQEKPEESAEKTEGRPEEPEQQAASGADEAAKADQPEKEAEKKTTAGAGSGSESDAESAAKTEPKPDANADAGTDASVDAASDSDTDAKADAASAPDSAPKREADAKTDAASEPGENIENVADDTTAAAAAKAATEDRARTAAEDEAKTAAANRAKSAAVDRAKAAAANKAKSAAAEKAKTAAANKAETAAEDEAKTAATDGAKAATANRLKTAAEDKTETATADKAKSAVADKAADRDERSAAGGEDAPQGPPAADDENRTGGAGGREKTAEGEAEAKDAEAKGTEAKNAEAKAAEAKRSVDQPTTVFKAARPKKPEVDQPTTMLKLGGSKFVPLKNPDVTTSVPHVGPERTTQQPLPPKPPLDLLAELTNTPPPAETPVRTIVRRVKIWTPLVLLLVIIFAAVQAFRPLPSPTLALTSKDSYTFDGAKLQLPWPDEGQGWIDGDGVGNMGNFGKQTPVAIGSVAKTMTSYIILRDHPLKPGEEGPKIKIDATAEKEGGYSKSGESTVNTLKAGQFLTEKQALSAVMIPSANNIARLLARWDLGSEAAFVKKMNDTAKELGMTNTKYTDPSGLKETTVSTAEDQVKLGRVVVKNPALVAITSAASWTDPTGHNWPNWNKLPFQMGAIGIKTGSTTAAGGNLLFASRKTVGGQTVTIVGAILGQHKGTSILETVNVVSKTALLAAQDALTSSKILKKGDVVGYVDDQLGGHTPVVLTKDVPAVGWAGLKVKLSFASDPVPHTAKAGTTVGTLTVGDGSAGAVKVPVALQKDLAEPGFTDKLTRLG